MTNGLQHEARVVSRNSGTYVTFDLWETLIIDEPQLDEERGRMRYEGLQNIVSNFGVEVPSSVMKRAYDESAIKFYDVWGSNIDISTAEQIRMILEYVSPDAVALCKDPKAMEELQEAYIAPLFTSPPHLNEDTRTTLAEMRARIGKIGLISNTGRTPGESLRRLLTRLDILKFFDATIFSNEVGYRKPDRRIFEAAAHELGTEVAKGIHIGDNPEADVWGAKQAGMRAVLYAYSLPEGFKQMPYSMLFLSRATRRVPDSEIKADARISSLKEAVRVVDSLKKGEATANV
jgi:putative hydrolase of the HAD superfamily